MSEYDLWNPLLWDIMPGWRLLKSRTYYHPADNSKYTYVQPGDWGLHSGDGVDFHWRVTPVLNPAIDLMAENNMKFDDIYDLLETDEYRPQVTAFEAAHADFEESLRVDFNRYGVSSTYENIWRFVNACKAGGWSPSNHTLKLSFSEWFVDHVARLITYNSGYTDPRIDEWYKTSMGDKTEEDRKSYYVQENPTCR